MTDPDQVRAYANADFSVPHEGFVSLLSEKFPTLPRTGRALDLGCGPGDISFRFARRFPGWSLVAVDAAAAMLELAGSTLRAGEFTSRISFHQVYLPAPNPFGPFELVFSNSLLHHLADPLVLWRTLREWGTSRVPIFVMDLMRPNSRAEAKELVETYASNEPAILKQDFHNSLLAAYRPEEVRAQLADCGLGHLEVEATTDRHFIVWGQLD